EVATVNCSVGAALARHVERDDARAVVERDDVNVWENGRDYVLAADAHQLVAHGFGVVEALDSQVVVDAEDDDAAACVCERDEGRPRVTGMEIVDRSQ